MVAMRHWIIVSSLALSVSAIQFGSFGCAGEVNSFDGKTTACLAEISEPDDQMRSYFVNNTELHHIRVSRFACANSERDAETQCKAVDPSGSPVLGLRTVREEPHDGLTIFGDSACAVSHLPGYQCNYSQIFAFTCPRLLGPVQMITTYSFYGYHFDSNQSLVHSCNYQPIMGRLCDIEWKCLVPVDSDWDCFTPAYKKRPATMTGSHQASLLAGEVVSAYSGTKGGGAITEAAPALSFDLNPGQLVAVNSLFLQFRDFRFEGEYRRFGSALLQKRVSATAVGDGSYSIPAGAARFAVTATNGDDGRGYLLDATNSTPLSIAGLDDPTGPRLQGTLSATLGGQTVYADLNNTQLAWSNRPPVAKAKVSETWFNSVDDTNPLRTITCADGTKLQWQGIIGAKTPVRLDGSASYDPDSGQSLIYGWDMGKGFATSGTQPITSVDLPEGEYVAYLTVQDSYHASAVSDGVHFKVRDQGNPCTNPLVRFHAVKPDFTHLTGFTGADLASIVDFTHTASTVSVPVSKPGRSAIEAVTDNKSTANRIYKFASKPDFGVAGLRDQHFVNPFDGLCPTSTAGLTGGLKAVCSGCGNGVCSEGETCATCAQDCGACDACGDGICDTDAGETCKTCSRDCGACNTCGDGVCLGETTSSCPADCYCGNNRCDSGENNYSCPGDCYCGNGTCDTPENATQCPNDCYCGNGKCDSGENNANCPQDCRCNDGICDPSESSSTPS